MPPPYLVVLTVVGIYGLFMGIIIESTKRGQKSGIPVCIDYNSIQLKKESELRNYAQQALDAIGSQHKLSGSKKIANRGQHVFNNGLLKFHHNVLEDLLKDKDVGGYDEQMENLVQDLTIPLNQSQQHSISSMVARFSSDESYVDFNAELYGEYARVLREALVAYLKADTSPDQNDRNGIQRIRRRVYFIASQMVKHEVYVDPMARDRWLQENQNNHGNYNKVRDALKKMFQNILQAFQKVSDKIRVFRWRNNWSWESDWQ